MSIAALHQVEAGFGKAKFRDFQPAAQQGAYPQVRGDFWRAQHGLGAEARVVVHHEILEIKTRLG